MSKPIVRRLTDLTPNEKIARNIYRTELGRVQTLSTLTECKKPVWISCFFDGTGNNYFEDGKGSTDASKTSYSNVAKLWRFASPRDGELDRTYSIYAQGVGTPFAEVGDTGTGIDKATGMANAAKGQARIGWVLEEFKKRVDMHMPHVNQINVAVFGFSRGSAEARAFVHQLAAKCGQIGENLVWTHSNGHGVNQPPRLVFYYMGILDTVASVGYGGSRIEKALPLAVAGTLAPIGMVAGGTLRAIDDGGHAAWAKDLSIPSYVRFCEHFVASHEVREKFPSDSVRQNLAIPQNCRETFYPGMHSDVGGGYSPITQEGRTNELANIPLCNLYLSAYAAGVPFKTPAEVIASAGALFNISDDLQKCFENYMTLVSEGSKGGTSQLEQQVINHMNNYYHWRWGRTERALKLRSKPDEAVRVTERGYKINSGEYDRYMLITDEEWETDVKNIAEKKTGFFTSKTYPHEDVIFEAWKGTLRKSLSPAKLALFDRFFDYYVHDSIAGFKNQMSDSGVGFVEFSRWARNRQYFMGKRGEKYLYWRYEGEAPATSGTKEALNMRGKEIDKQSSVA